MLLGCEWFIGHGVEDTVEEVVRTWIVVVKEGELRCDTIGNVLSERLKVEVGREGGGVGDFVKESRDCLTQGCGIVGSVRWRSVRIGGTVGRFFF